MQLKANAELQTRRVNYFSAQALASRNVLKPQGSIMTIHRRLITVAVFASLTALSTVVLSNSREGRADKNESVIEAVVTGTLHFEEGRGYFISVTSNENSGWENRVWLLISEDKLLGRRFEGLMEKKVIAKGELEQLPDNVQAMVPPHGMYLKKLRLKVRRRNSLSPT